MDSLRAVRFAIAVVVALVMSTFLYWKHATRAVGEPELCRSVEKHVVSMSKRADGAIRDEELGRVETIRDLCEQRLSTSQARCILKARTLVEVDGCTGH